jgi:hypothetical protein
LKPTKAWFVVVRAVALTLKVSSSQIPCEMKLRNKKDKVEDSRKENSTARLMPRV